MRIDELPRSENIDDRRGVRMRRGGIGIGTLLVLGLIGWALGIDPRLLIGGAEVLTGGQQSQPPSASDTARTGNAPSDQMKEFVSAVLGSTEVQWTEVFAQGNTRYQPPRLVMFSEATSSACGFAQAAMGPFYCPNDRQVYLDTSFFEDLQRRFGACETEKACQFSQAYVIAHEIGHHVQNLLGILPRLQQMQQGMDRGDANRLQVMAELQADCFAGIWANRSQQRWKFLDPGDVETALQTASAIGDDRLQRRSQGYVVPDAFTHGSSQQRVRWFSTGLKSGEITSCDTFNAAQL
ncbi:MAG: KPN_02809 family neutral zinc metallopeptidase [Rhodoplanes sp.]|jgi:predicted metalloprotease